MAETVSQDPATYRKYFFVANTQRIATIFAAMPEQPAMGAEAFEGAYLRVAATSEAKAIEKINIISNAEYWDLHHMLEASATAIS